MIPKIIHYCWLSEDPIPTSLQTYMRSWKKHLPEYEFRLWNLNRFDINSSVWVQEAFRAKKYAFAADYIRCYALYNYGGIYLDMDVEVLKSFNDLLNLPYFIGMEDSPAAIEAAIIGIEKRHALSQELMDHYKNRHFVSPSGNYDMRTLPEIMRQIIDEKFHYTKITSISDFRKVPIREICIFPQDWFSPKSLLNGKIHLTENTYTIHHFSGSWVSPIRKKIRWIVIFVGGVRLKDFLKRLFVKDNDCYKKRNQDFY